MHDVYKIDSVLVANKKVAVTKPAKNKFSFPFDAEKGDKFTATIFYNGKAPLSTNDWGNGIVQKKDLTYNSDVMYSLTVPFHGHEWFPCKQVLTDLIDSVTMKITTDTSSTVASNGLLISDLKLGNGKHTLVWKTQYPINYYLINFVVGKYIKYDFDVTLPGKAEKMPVTNYLFDAKALQAKKPILDNLPAFLTNYSNLFGLYPFHKEKFGTVIVPLSGGMEHQTMINLATNYDKYLVAHELSHQWFGDNVSVKSLHDMWLNEGWASYCEYLTAEKLYPTEAVKYMTNFHNSSYAVNKRVYVDDTTSFTPIYNTEVYNKGAVICHILRDEIGDSLFFGGVTALQSFYKNKNIDVADFKAFIEKYSGKDLTIFFNQWYYGYGYPRFTLTYSNKNNTLFLRSVQQGSSTQTPLFKTKVEFLIKRNTAPDTTISVYQNQNDQTFAIPKINDVKSISLDPRNVLLEKVVSIKADPALSAFEETESLDFTFFPNPTQDILNIQTNLGGEFNVELCSKNGMNRLKKEKMTSGSLQIDLSDLENDYYFVKIIQNKKVLLVKKIVLIH